MINYKHKRPVATIDKNTSFLLFYHVKGPTGQHKDAVRCNSCRSFLQTDSNNYSDIIDTLITQPSWVKCQLQNKREEITFKSLHSNNDESKTQQAAKVNQRITKFYKSRSLFLYRLVFPFLKHINLLFQQKTLVAAVAKI